jgi:hypothetical protein
VTSTRKLFLASVMALSFVTGAASANAPAGRYTISGATVYDTRTKLTWQQAVPTTTYAWSDAKSYCGTATLAASLGGTGWRLPTVRELSTLFDASQTSGASIDQSAFPSTPAAFFWTSTPVAGSSTSAWTVYFANSGPNPATSTTLYNVRCVR